MPQVEGPHPLEKVRRGGQALLRRALNRPWDPPVLVALILVVALSAYGLTRVASALGREETSGTWEAAPTAGLDPETLDTLATTVAGVMAGERSPGVGDVPPRLREELGPVYAALREGGLRVGSEWGRAGTTLEAVVDAVGAAQATAGDADLGQVDAVELCLSHSYEDIEPGSEESGRLTNIHRGVVGMEVAFEEHNGRYSPTLMLARNLSFPRALERFMESAGAREQDVASRRLRVRAFECEQVLVLLEDRPRAVAMMRGNEIVALEDVTHAEVEQLADGLVSWLTRAVQADGRLTYKYWPSRGEESDSNNMIRQWMGTIALIRTHAAGLGQDDELLASIERNIRYNLEHFYDTDGELGLVTYDGKVKLGAVALAALALLEYPDDDAFRDELEALNRTVDHLWSDDGSFRTFYEPPDRNDNQNFYPGEALVYWAARYQRDPDPDLLDRFMRSFRYYRAWHLDDDNRNPAFVPWHTQAYYAVWQRTGDPELRDFIFDMNDWLLDMQEWDDAVYPDARGRFYDRERPGFGPPHASSTGVYLEGLADAYRLAVETGEAERAERYRSTIRRGLRSVMQLQFTDEIDLYYISKRDRARGGARTTVYDNEIRVDNVQHNLMAVLKLLEAFEPADLQRPDADPS